MGIIEDMRFAEESVRLEPGDIVVLYTDGVNETMNATQDEFGLERLHDVITATRGQSSAAVCDAITEALDAFAGSAPQFDDTILSSFNAWHRNPIAGNLAEQHA